MLVCPMYCAMYFMLYPVFCLVYAYVHVCFVLATQSYSVVQQPLLLYSYYKSLGAFMSNLP